MSEASLFGLAGKTFLIVGGGQGMGEATVRLLASLGANVAVLDMDAERAARIANEAEKAGIRALPVTADVTDAAALTAAIDTAERDLGPLDGMATIVGMAAWSSILDMTDEIWDQDHRRNLRYFFVAAREVARRIIARGAAGSIVAVSSIDGIRSAPNHAAYGAAKAGLINLVKTMAVEWGEAGVRVNCVAPGGIVTPRLPVVDAEAERQSMWWLPISRRGETSDIAKAVAFFLSDLSPYVTGQTLAVDGGFEATTLFGRKPSVRAGETYGAKS